jgi:peptidoglycan/LPS O-acetylase OafA/YrhL
VLVETHQEALSRHNNFDLVRLLAAYQVVAMHAGEHLRFHVPEVLTFFPGVPIFFIVSGFLVTASLAHCGSLWEYARNRALRIYPALWVMTGVTLVVLVAAGQLTSETPRLRLLAYILGQCTVFQLVEGGLGMFRGFGTGGVNGALWTIATELQFYLALPLIFLFANRFPRRRTALLWGLLLGSLLLYEVQLPAWTAPGRSHLGVAGALQTILYTSVLTHLFGFLIGVLCYIHLPSVHRWVRGKLLYWVVAYAGFVLVTWQVFGLAGWSLQMNVFAMTAQRLLLAGLVLSVAFSFTGLSHALLRGNDISYGVYIYHMLIINSLLQLGMIGTPFYGVSAALIAALVALCSWRWIERPMLRLKKAASGPLSARPVAAEKPVASR